MEKRGKQLRTTETSASLRTPCQGHNPRSRLPIDPDSRQHSRASLLRFTAPGQRETPADQSGPDDPPAAVLPQTPAVLLTTLQQVNLIGAPAPAFQLVVSFLLATGLRWGDAIALLVTDSGSSPSTVRVKRAWKRGEGRDDHLGPAKTLKSWRAVSLPVQIIPDLQELAQEVGKDFLFHSPESGRLRQVWFHDRVWNLEVNEVGLALRPRIHGFRHTHASMLLVPGLPIHIVQYRLGHESTQTRGNTYGHLIPDVGRIADEMMALAMSTAFLELLEASGVSHHPGILPGCDCLVRRRRRWSSGVRST